MNYIFYNKIPIEKRKLVRKSIEKSMAMEKRKKELLEALVIKPVEEAISLYKDFLKNKIHYDYLIKRRKYISEYMKKSLGELGNEGENNGTENKNK